MRCVEVWAGREIQPVYQGIATTGEELETLRTKTLQFNPESTIVYKDKTGKRLNDFQAAKEYLQSDNKNKEE